MKNAYNSKYKHVKIYSLVYTDEGLVVFSRQGLMSHYAALALLELAIQTSLASTCLASLGLGLKAYSIT